MSKTITLRGLRLRDVTEIAPSLFTGRDDENQLRLFGPEWFFGYVNAWPTPKRPNGYQCAVFAREPRVRFQRRRISRRFAEKLLVAKGLELVAAAKA